MKNTAKKKPVKILPIDQRVAKLDPQFTDRFQKWKEESYGGVQFIDWLKHQLRPKEQRELALVLLEHAARETCWIRENAKEMNHLQAHNAEVRRGVWAHAAMLAQEVRL